MGKKIRRKQRLQCKNCGSISYIPYVEIDKDLKSVELEKKTMMTTERKLMNQAIRAAYAASKKK